MLLVTFRKTQRDRIGVPSLAQITTISALLLLLLSTSSFAQESYDQLLRHWDYDKSASLNVKEVGVQKRGDVTIHDISYSSPVGDRAAFIGRNGGKVPAYLVLPSGKGPFPAVIYGHWCMPGSEKKNRTEFLDEAVVLAHSGVISLLPDHVIVHPGFVEDNTPLNEQQIQVEVQQDINLRRGADLLLARKDVDPKRLAYVGHSCDAGAGAFLTGIDKRFKAFVLMAGDIAVDADMKTKTFQDYRQKVGPEKFDSYLVRTSWVDGGKYVPHAAPAAVFLQYASRESFLNADLARQYIDYVSKPRKLKIYDAEHALSPEATRDRIAFLAEQLSFKPPNPAAVNAIPALVQPPWPKDN